MMRRCPRAAGLLFILSAMLCVTQAGAASFPVLDEAPGSVGRGDTVSITFDAGAATQCELRFQGPKGLLTGPFAHTSAGGEQRVGWRVPPRGARGRWHGRLTCSGEQVQENSTDLTMRLTGDPRSGRRAALVERGSLQWRSLAPPGAPGPDVAAGGDLAGRYPNPVIAPGVVTPEKLSAAGTAPGQILQSNGNAVSWVFAPFQPRLERTFVVGASGTPAENGTSLRGVVDGITAGPSNPALVLLGPGAYDVGGEGLAMKPFVDLEGSGEGLTTITGPGHSSDLGTVSGADSAELRFLTVENSGGGDVAIAIRNEGTSPRITHVTALAGGSTTAKGIVNTASAAPTISDSTVRVVGEPGGFATGIHNSGAPARIERVNVAVSGGEADFGIDNAASGPVRIRDSVVTATASGAEPSTALRASAASMVYVDGSRLAGDNAVDGKSNTQYRIGASLLEGIATFSPSASSSRCVFSYSAAYTALGPGCQ